MKLQIKILNGKDCVVDAGPDTTISAVKHLVAAKLGVPAASQRLVYRGKPLADEQTINKAGLADNTKLYLVVCSVSRKHPSGLRKMLENQLKNQILKYNI